MASSHAAASDREFFFGGRQFLSSNEAFVLVCGVVTVISLDAATVRVSWAWTITTTSSSHTSIIVQRRIIRTPRVGFDCVLHGRDGHSYIVRLLFDRCEDAKPTGQKLCGTLDRRGRVTTRGCPVVIRSRRPTQIPWTVQVLDSVAFYVTEGGTSEDAVRFLR